MIRTTCKEVQTHGCEKLDCIFDFYTFFYKEVGFSNVAFIPFKGNRFNVLFYNGGILYFLYNHLKHFFESVKDENKLLKAVHSDLQIKSYLCGCRALGLINKFVTGPLWRLLESGIHILDMNKHYEKMSSLFFDLSVDAKESMLGNVIYFENVEISKDDVYNSRILPSNILNESTKQCLEIIFGSLCIITRRLLDDHLEDGKYSNPSQQLVKETVSVSTTRSIVIMNRTNKTPEWRKKLTPEKRSLVMKWARESVSKQF